MTVRRYFSIHFVDFYNWNQSRATRKSNVWWESTFCSVIVKCWKCIHVTRDDNIKNIESVKIYEEVKEILIKKIIEILRKFWLFISCVFQFFWNVFLFSYICQWFLASKVTVFEVRKVLCHRYNTSFFNDRCMKLKYKIWSQSI